MTAQKLVSENRQSASGIPTPSLLDLFKFKPNAGNHVIKTNDSNLRFRTELTGQLLKDFSIRDIHLIRSIFREELICEQKTGQQENLYQLCFYLFSLQQIEDIFLLFEAKFNTSSLETRAAIDWELLTLGHPVDDVVDFVSERLKHDPILLQKYPTIQEEILFLSEHLGKVDFELYQKRLKQYFFELNEPTPATEEPESQNEPSPEQSEKLPSDWSAFAKIILLVVVAFFLCVVAYNSTEYSDETIKITVFLFCTVLFSLIFRHLNRPRQILKIETEGTGNTPAKYADVTIGPNKKQIRTQILLWSVCIVFVLGYILRQNNFSSTPEILVILSLVIVYSIFKIERENKSLTSSELFLTFNYEGINYKKQLIPWSELRGLYTTKDENETTFFLDFEDRKKGIFIIKLNELDTKALDIYKYIKIFNTNSKIVVFEEMFS